MKYLAFDAIWSKCKKTLIATGLDEELLELNVGFPFFIT